jgi:gas vesicle structural protein
MPDHPLTPEDELSLAELVNRVLDKGAVVSGDVVISVAGVDLIYLGLRLLLSSVESMRDKLEPGGGF